MNQPLEQLIDALSEALADGVTIDESCRRFAAGAFGADTADDILALLAAPEEAGAEPLVELVFSPDPEQLASLDEAITGANCGRSDVQTVIDALCERLATVPVVIDGAVSHSIAVTDLAISAFVSGCRLTRQVPEPVRRMLSGRLPAHRFPPVATACRLAGARWTGDCIDAVTCFIEGFDPQSPLFEQLLLEVIHTASEIPAGMDLTTTLMRKKCRLSEHLQQAQQYEKSRQRHNMETLMMRGMHPPAESIEALVAAMDRVEMIGRILLGPDALDGVPMAREAELSSDDIRDDAGWQRTIRFLT